MFAVSSRSCSSPRLQPELDPRQRQLRPDDVLVSEQEMTIYRHIRQVSPFRHGREPAGRLGNRVDQASSAAYRLHVVCIYHGADPEGSVRVVAPLYLGQARVVATPERLGSIFFSDAGLRC